MNRTLVLAVGLAACTPEPPAAPPPATVPQGPLPDPVTLHGVDLAMTIDPRTDGFSGEVDLHLALGAQREVLWMHGQDLSVTEVTITPQGGSPVPATWTPVGTTGTARVTPARSLAPGDLTVHIEWSAPFATDLAGLFKVEERGSAFALAKSESIQARRAMPSFDEPRFKAPYRVKLTVPTGDVVVGNGRELERIPAGDGLETVILAETAPLPTYLLSLAVGPFESIDGPSLPPGPLRPEPVPLRGFARSGKAADLGVALTATPPLVAILEAAFGLPFPDEKLDIVAAPAWPSGATELAAAITYRESRILLGPADGPGIDPDARQRMLSTHAHELAHMWFGNMVTPSWWDDLWLKEGFATWASALALGTWEPLGGHTLRAQDRVLSALAADSLATARSVREPVRHDADIRNAYDAITYGKGMAILEMVDHGYGPEVFRPAVRAWLEQSAGGSTDTEAFLRAVTESSGSRDMAATFTTFLEQPGVPVVQVAVDCPNGHPPTATLRQSRYRPRGSRVRDDQRWTIPVCLAVDTAPEPVCTVLRTKDQEVELPGDRCPTLVRPNPGGHGYYRFTGSTASWSRLAQVLPELPAAEARMVVDSAAAAFAAQTVPAPTVLDVFEAAARHPARQVVTAPLPTIDGWTRHLPAAAEPQLAAWARDTWRPARTRAARDRSADGRILGVALQTFFATTFHDADARATLIAELERRLAGDTAALPASSAAAALRVVAEDRGAAALADTTARILALDDPRLEAAALTASGHLRDPQERAAAYAEVLTGELDPRVAFERLSALMDTRNPSKRDDVRQRLEADWDRVAEVIPRQWRRRLPAVRAGAACSESEATDLLAWFAGEAGDAAPGHARSLAQTAERVQLCAAARWVGPALASALP